MNATSRSISAGRTRQCPHCKAVILDSLSICPGCQHHLRYDQEAMRRQAAAKEALRVEGSFSHPSRESPCEYHVMLSVRNERGDEISRQVMNVGSLRGGEQRSFVMTLEVLPNQPPPAAPKTAGSSAAPEPPPTEAPKPKVGGYDLKPPGLKPKN